MKNLHFLKIKSNHLVISKSQKLKIFLLTSKQLKQPAVTIQIGRTGHRIWFERSFKVIFPQKINTGGRIWKVLSNLWMGSSRKSTGQSRVREVKPIVTSWNRDVIINYVMIECNLSCNDVQENEICLNDSCKSSDGNENECKYSLWSPWSICNCKTQA